ncbi:MAG: DUF4870 domain-containing protein [Phycisphaerae bacterium]
MNENMQENVSPLSNEEKMWAMLCHLAGFAIFIPPVGHVLAPLVLWLMKKGSSAFIDDHGKEALNFQISITIYMAISGLLVCILIGIPLVLAVLIFDIVMMINAANAASNGQRYRYPYLFRFIK